MLSVHCAQSFRCYDFVASVGRCCLHVDFECFKLALRPTLRPKLMNLGSFLTCPNDKHDEEARSAILLLFDYPSGPSSRFLNFSHSLTTRLISLLFGNILKWNISLLLNRSWFFLCSCSTMPLARDFALVLLCQPFQNAMKWVNKYSFYHQNLLIFLIYIFEFFINKALLGSNSIYLHNFMGKNVKDN